jgi:hypothetical protein
MVEIGGRGYEHSEIAIEEPRIAKLLFSDVRFASVWLPLRLYLRWTGEALPEYWKRGLKMTAGSASTNGMLFAIATWLVLAWRNAGWIGLDRWLLPTVGTPWKPGHVFRRIATAKAN